MPPPAAPSPHADRLASSVTAGPSRRGGMHGGNPAFTLHSPAERTASAAGAAAATLPPPGHPLSSSARHRRRRHWDDPDIVSAIAGAAAGALTATLVCPLDVLKTRLQVQRGGPSGIGVNLTRIVSEEGVRGLYRGLTPTLAALLPNWAVYFSVYDRLKAAAAARGAARAAKNGSSAASHFSAAHPAPGTGPLSHMAAATGAGIATLAVTNPLWVVKTRLQTQTLTLAGSAGAVRAGGGILYTSAADALVRIAREEGLRGLYAGFLPSLVGVTHVAIQFPLYERLKAGLAEKAPSLLTPQGELGAAGLGLASAASKIAASALTYPHEVVRSHMHVEGSVSPAAVARTCRAIAAESGIAGFYRGCGTNLLRTTPAAALTFTSYELIARQLRAAGARQREWEAMEEEGDGGGGVGKLME